MQRNDKPDAINRLKELEKAAQQGDEKAKLTLAIENMTSKKEKLVREAVKVLKEFADKKNLSARYHLAIHQQYMTPPKLDSAIKIYEEIVKEFSESKGEPEFITIQSHLQLGKIYNQKAKTDPAYYDRAEQVFGAIAHLSIDAEYHTNNVYFDKLLITSDQIEKNRLRTRWLNKTIELADKRFYQSMLDASLVYMQHYGDNPHFNIAPDEALAEKYLLSAFLLEKNGEVSFLLYTLYESKQLYDLAMKYLKVSVDKQYTKAEYVYGVRLLAKGDKAGNLWISAASKKNYHEALFHEYTMFKKIAEQETNQLKRKKMFSEAYNKLEQAAQAGSVDAMILAARGAMSASYADYADDYETRMERARNYLQTIIHNENYITFPHLKVQKELADKWLSLWQEAWVQNANVVFDANGMSGKVAEIKAQIENEAHSSDESSVKAKKKKKAKKKPVVFPAVHKQKYTKPDLASVVEEPEEKSEVQLEEKRTDLSSIPEETVEEVEAVTTPVLKPVPHLTVDIPENNHAQIEIIENIIALPVQQDIQPTAATPQIESQVEPALDVMTVLSWGSCISNVDYFILFVESIMNGGIFTGKQEIALAMMSTITSDLRAYELLLPKIFMAGNASALFATLMDHGVLQHLFPVINFSDPSSLVWLYKNLTQTDETYYRFERDAVARPEMPKRNLSLTYVYGYLLATAQDVSDYKQLVNLWFVPEIVRKELSENNFAILIRFIANRYPELNINPYLPPPPLLNTASITQTAASFFNAGERSGFFAAQSSIQSEAEDSSLSGDIQHATHSRP